MEYAKYYLWTAFDVSCLTSHISLHSLTPTLSISAIITILQIGNAGKDPLIRHTALLSMICALMSLLYGCMYVIRFGTMQKTYKGAEWAYVCAFAFIYCVYMNLSSLPDDYLGGRQTSNCNFLECLGDACYACYMAGMVRLAQRSKHNVCLSTYMRITEL